MGWVARSLAALVAAAVGVAASNCAEDTPVLPFQTFGSQLTDLECAFNLTCGAECNAAACRERYERWLAVLNSRMAAGTVAYDEAAAEACIEALTRRNAVGCGIGTVAFAQAYEQCQLPFVGTVPVGGQCLMHDDCTTRSCSRTPDCLVACCEGTCLPASAPAVVGEPCVAVSCIDGAFFQNNICVPELSAGEACDTYDMCLDSQCVAGVCRSYAGLGEACDPNVLGDCLTARTAWCDPADLTCKPRRHVGESCGPGPDLCVMCASCSNGTCTPPPGPGEPCAVGTCSLAYTCQNAVCVPSDDYAACGG
jgi:hypothetical protein